jgi:hypothetical protein
MPTVNFKGVELPVIDLRRPEFRERDDADALEALRASYEAEEWRRRGMPPIVMKILFMLASRNAPLLKAIARPGSNYLDGLSTYVMKLRPEQLPPPFDNKIDRKIVGSPFAVSVRLRMQQLAQIVAGVLEREMEEQATGDLHLVNIAGGPAMDSINALLFLDEKGKLTGRSISIQVLDREAEGADFGVRVLEALILDGAFHSAHVTLRHRSYDWTSPGTLAEFIRPLGKDGSIVCAMSEGGLFEYADDDIVLSNLAALADGGVKFVAGSVTRSDDLTRRALRQMRFRLYPRGAAGLELLANSVSYQVTEVRHALASDQVLLMPSTAG